MSIDMPAVYRPDYITIFPTHPAFPLLEHMRNQEAELAKLRATCEEWKQAFDRVALKKKRKRK